MKYFWPGAEFGKSRRFRGSPVIVRATVALLLGLSFPPIAGVLNATPASAIQQGGIIGIKEQEDFGLVSIDGTGGGCSGVLLVNDWLLTAGHCASADRVTVGQLTATISIGTSSRSVSPADAVYLFGGSPDGVGADLALVHLSAPLIVHGRGTGFTNRLWSGSMAQLGTGTRTVSIYGQGFLHYTACANDTRPNFGDYGGSYRSGTASVGGVGYEPNVLPGNIENPRTTWSEQPSGQYMQLLPTTDNQLPLSGDSGGPSFIFNPGSSRPYLVGIQSSGNCVPQGTSAEPIATDAYQVAIPAVRDWIAAVLASRWVPGSTGANVWVGPAEIAGVRWPVNDVNTAGWAQSARAAAAMCYARGYAGGHFDGHQGALNNITGSGILCSGGDTLWQDVTAATISGTGWDFTNVDEVNWAQANRAAERICASIPGHYVGGHFNGHQRSGTYGLFCYRGGARRFDATLAQLAATGWPLPTSTLDDVPWAQAARAATGFCRTKSYDGGFMSGQFVTGQKYRIVCQK